MRRAKGRCRRKLARANVTGIVTRAAKANFSRGYRGRLLTARAKRIIMGAWMM